MSYSKSSGGCFNLAVLLVVVLALLATAGTYVIGGGSVFGPTRTRDVTVQRLYVDNSGKSSHYMVGTDAGVFEVDNGLMLGVWNADELYARLKEGQRFRVTTEGNKIIVPVLFQTYPYVTAVEKIADAPK